MKETASLFNLDGSLILSYIPNDRKIMTPSTIPWQTIRDVAMLTFGHHVVCVISGKMKTEQMSDKVFKMTGEFSLQEGKMIGKNHTDFTNGKTVDMMWEGISDYND